MGLANKEKLIKRLEAIMYNDTFVANKVKAILELIEDFITNKIK